MSLPAQVATAPDDVSRRRGREVLLPGDGPEAGLSHPATIAERVLSEGLFEQVDPLVLECVRDLHRLAGEMRTSPDAGAELVATLSEADTSTLGQLARIASLSLALGNLADDVVRVRDERTEIRDETFPQPESLEDGALRVRRTDRCPELSIAPVLTAHPTAIARRSVLSKQRTVIAALDRLCDEDLGARARGRLMDELREAIAIWWATNEVRTMRPRVQDEVRRVLHFFETALVDATVEAELRETDLHQSDQHPFERDEPIRRKLAFVLARLGNTLAFARNLPSREPGYDSPEQLQRDLELIVDSLGSRFVAHGGGSSASCGR